MAKKRVARQATPGLLVTKEGQVLRLSYNRSGHVWTPLSEHEAAAPLGQRDAS